MAEADLQPILTGEAVILRPIRSEDWDEMYAAASDPLIWEGHPATDRWKEPNFRQVFDSAIAMRSAFAILDRESGRIIGCTRYCSHDAQAKTIEIGWTFLIRSRWGDGTNAEVKRLMLAHAFTFVDRVVFLIAETNHRSRRAVEKIGGRLTNRFEDREMNGRIVRHLVYEVTECPASPM